MKRNPHMHIGLSLSPFGHHPAAWRRKIGAAALDARHFAAQAQKAQSGALDFVYLADTQSIRPESRLSPQAVPFEPTTLVAALATIAGRIGFVATAATGQHEVYNLARRFASLDIISGGRVGWNVVASGPESWNSEYVAVVSALWDSWEDDAFTYDKTAGRFFAPEKMHVLNHRGKHFTVRGPLNVNRSPQGKPVVALGLTPETASIAAHSADLVLTSMAAEAGRELIAEFLRLLDLHGRKRSDVRVMANVVPWIGATAAQAQDAFGQLNARSLPEFAEKPPGCNVIGTAIEIADALQGWFESDEIDGFTILPPVMPDDLDAFIDLVVPELRRRGVFRSEYEGATLRAHLALDRPRYTAPASERAP